MSSFQPRQTGRRLRGGTRGSPKCNCTFCPKSGASKPTRARLRPGPCSTSLLCSCSPLEWSRFRPCTCPHAQQKQACTRTGARSSTATTSRTFQLQDPRPLENRARMGRAIGPFPLLFSFELLIGRGRILGVTRRRVRSFNRRAAGVRGKVWWTSCDQGPEQRPQWPLSLHPLQVRPMEKASVQEGTQAILNLLSSGSEPRSGEDKGACRLISDPTLRPPLPTSPLICLAQGPFFLTCPVTAEIRVEVDPGLVLVDLGRRWDPDHPRWKVFPQGREWQGVRSLSPPFSTPLPSSAKSAHKG